MKIALLAQSYPPMVSGAALVVWRLASGLAEEGHQVRVLAASDIGHGYDETCGNLQVTRLSAHRNPFRVGQHFLLWPRRELCAALRQFQPDVIHSHDPVVSSIALGSTCPGVPRVLTVHQLPWFVSLFAPPPFRPGIEWLLWKYGAWLYRRFTAIVTPSQTIADLVASHTSARPQPISNGVDTSRFNPEPSSPNEAEALREKYNLDPHLPVILYAGRVDADKRVKLVLKAAAEALKTAKAQLLIVGDGKQLDEMKQRAQDLNIDDRTCFTGFVPLSGDLAGLYRLATVFITASEVEIQSSVVLEAAASGLPVVTVNASSMPEFVRDGETGFIVPRKDVPALAARLVTLINNPTQAQAMGQAALAMARAHSHQRAVEKHIQFYKSLIASQL